MISSRNARMIDLVDHLAQDTSPAQSFRKFREIKLSSGGFITEERWREGDELVITRTKETTRVLGFGQERISSVKTIRLPAIVPYSLIIKHAQVRTDDDAVPPYVEDDGWEHDLQQLKDFAGTYENFRKARGYLCGDGRGRDPERVVVTDNSYCQESRSDRIKHLRQLGASKQVAAERVASDDRAYIDQIVEWRKDGYDCWWVQIEITIGGKLYEANVGGVDDYDYATEEVVADMGCEITHQLKKDGFDVNDDVERTAYQAAMLASKKQRLKYNLNMFNWE